MLVAGCRDDGADDAAPITAAETTTTTVSVENEILEAYEAASQAVVATYNPPDRDHPDLLATHAGESLDTYQQDLEDMAAKRWSLDGAIDTSAVVESVDGDTAVVRDCAHRRSQRIDTATRTPLGGPDDAVLDLEVEMNASTARWKVVDKSSKS